MLFSVGETVGTVVVVVVVVVLDGAGASPPPQAVNAPIEMAAAMPRPAATRRVSRLFMMLSNLRCWQDAAINADCTLSSRRVSSQGKSSLPQRHIYALETCRL